MLPRIPATIFSALFFLLLGLSTLSGCRREDSNSGAKSDSNSGAKSDSKDLPSPSPSDPTEVLQFFPPEKALEYGKELHAISTASGVSLEQTKLAHGREDFAAMIIDPQTKRGQSLEVAVKTTGDEQQKIQVQIFRLNASEEGARLMHEGTLLSSEQPEPEAESIGAVDYYSFHNWKTNWTFKIPDQRKSGWLSGLYTVVLIDPTGKKLLLPFVLQDQEAPARLLVVLPFLTTQGAYNRDILNREHSKSLYTGWLDGKYAPAEKAAAVSLVRPCEPSKCSRRTWVYSAPLIHFLESRGVPVVYTTDWAIYRDPSILTRYPAVLWNYHPEYIPWNVYEATLKAVERGVHLLSFMANGFYWRVEIKKDQKGQEIMICDRSNQNHLWRRQRKPGYGSLAEQRLFYSMYPDEKGAWGGAKMPLLLNPAKGSQQSGADAMDHWIFQGSNFELGDEISEAVGGEIDRTHKNYSLPETKDLLLLESNFKNASGRTFPVHTAFLERPNGQMTFHTGSHIAQMALDREEATDKKFQHVVQNLISKMIDSTSIAAPSPAP